MIYRLLVVLALTGCGPASHSAGGSTASSMMLSAVVSSDGAVFVIPMPPQMWPRAQADTLATTQEQRHLAWYVSWDSVPAEQWGMGCCGIGVRIHVPNPAPSSLAELLPAATTESFQTVPTDQHIFRVENAPEVVLGVVGEALEIRLGESALLVQLQRLRPDSLQVRSWAWGANSFAFAWVKPRYQL